MRTLYLDCFSGISGDMIVGALIDAGADFPAIQTALSSLHVHGFRLEAGKVNKRGIQATQFHVVIEAAEHHPHRHLHTIVEIIRAGALPDSVKNAAIQTFERLAEAEAAVHGTTVEKIHFHEVGAVDSIVDIVAAHYAMHLLGIERVFSSALHVGSGMVQCDHGWMPVPAPATAKLLEGKPTYGGEVQGELVTPTGAAIAVQCAVSFGPAPMMRVEHIGYGSGTRDYPDRPNVLRVMIGELEASFATEPITVIEANIDDMNPELLPPLVDALLAAGARDAFLTPILGKKGRPGYCVTALCDEERAQAVSDALFRHSSTFGLRMRREQRQVLERDWKSVRTPWGAVRVKRAWHGGEVHHAAPEFEDCRARAEAAGVSIKQVYEAAFASAIQGAYDDV
jgi:pyridinium-3,5-bisthiocarboxylic acid mononucleotide nickel chelatase